MNMDTSNSYYMGQFSDSCFQLPKYPTLASKPSQMLKKPRNQQKQSPKNKLTVRGLQYPDDVSGSINFKFLVNIGDSLTSCIYSKKLKKLYLMANHLLRLKFTWMPTYEPLFLRSAMVFAEEFHEATPVHRCYAHMRPELPHNTGLGYAQLQNVFRVYDIVNKYESVYESDVNRILTTKTILKAESGEAWFNFQFFCLNSCPGINRRPTKMVFLIENSMGVVFAKRSLFIHICSNPKRDLERDESRLDTDSKKKKVKKQLQKQSPLPPLPPIKPPGTCDDDETVYSLNIDVLGEENYKAVLKYAYDVMAAQAIRTGNHQLFKPHMDAVLAKEQLADHLV